MANAVKLTEQQKATLLSFATSTRKDGMKTILSNSEVSYDQIEGMIQPAKKADAKSIFEQAEQDNPSSEKSDRFVVTLKGYKRPISKILNDREAKDWLKDDEFEVISRKQSEKESGFVSYNLKKKSDGSTNLIEAQILIKLLRVEDAVIIDEENQVADLTDAIPTNFAVENMTLIAL